MVFPFMYLYNYDTMTSYIYDSYSESISLKHDFNFISIHMLEPHKPKKELSMYGIW